MKHRLKLVSLFVYLLSTLSFAQATPKVTPISIYTEEQTAIMVKKFEPQFVVKLKSNPTTGYSWFLREYDPSLIAPISHSYESPQDTKLMGAPGFEVWTFKLKPAAFLVPQQTVLRFIYARPWEASGQSNQTVFRISTSQ